MRAYDIIYKKRNNKELSQEEIKFFIEQYHKNNIPDYQMSALLMAIYFSGLNSNETFFLTKQMIESGVSLDFSNLNGPVADKHSTGGVGDGTSLVIAPILASCGIYVPMMSGRALGHTGGTLDKLESIPNFNVNLTMNQFKSVLKKNYFAMIGQTKDIAPVDKRTYALRDVTATVESIPLIAASIMSKKIAEGTKYLLLDVKFGDAAFIQDIKKSKLLAQTMISIGKKFNRSVKAVITNMNVPLGNFVGNSLEIIQTIEVLKGNIKNDFFDLCVDLSSIMLVQTKNAKNISEAKKIVLEKISSGKALEKFIKMIELQGGNPKVVDNYSIFKKAKNKYSVKAKKSGYISSIQTRNMGIVSCLLGAGRLKTSDKIDHSAGIQIYKKYGDYVKKDEVLFNLYYNNTNVDSAISMAESLYNIADVKPKKIKLIKDIIS